MDLRSKAVSGVKWTSLSTVVITVLQLGQLLILSRLLSVDEFGLMAIVTIIISLIRAFADLGVTAALIHFQDSTREQISTLYWLNIITGVVIYLLILLLNPVIAVFYPEPELLPILNIVAISMIISPLGSIFQTLFQKEMLFDILAKQEIAATTVATITTIILAYLGFGVWSLVVGQLLNMAVKTLSLIFYASGKIKISFYFKFSDVKGYLNFGVFQMGERGINFLSERIDQLIIGSMMGATSLGLYNFAYNLVSQPVTVLGPVLMKVGFPYFAKLQDNRAELRNAYLRILQVLMLVISPLLIGLGAAATELIPVVFDPKWSESVPNIRILILVFILRTAATPAGSLMLAVGRADLGFKWNLALFVISLPLLYFVSTTGEPVYIALALLLLQIALFYPNYKLLVAPFTGNFFPGYFSAIFKPVAVFMVMGVGVWLFSRLQFTGDLAVKLVTEIALGAVMSAALAFLFYRKELPSLLKLVRNG